MELRGKEDISGKGPQLETNLTARSFWGQGGALSSLEFGFKTAVKSSLPFKRQVTAGGGGRTVFSVMKVQGGAMRRAATSEGPPPDNRNMVTRQLGTRWLQPPACCGYQAPDI